MRTYLECIPCFMNQALRAGNIASNDVRVIKKILDVVGSRIKDISLEATPPETGAMIYQTVREISGVDDPYKQIKENNIAEALNLYTDLKDIVAKSEDRLFTAIRIAIAGNVIDLGVNKEFDIKKDLYKILKQDFAINNYKHFKAELNKAKSVLYIGDNAGETVFDKILIEELRKHVNYVVREIPVINDATMDDAIASGLDEVATLMSSGTTAPGTIMSLCNKKFINKFNDPDYLVISKGQGNYEGLSQVKRKVFFMLKAKCNVLARNLGVKENDIVLKML